MTRKEFIDGVRAVQNDLRRFLTALCCGDSQEADDIAQEAFVKAYISLDSLKNSSKFRSWVFTIAYRLFLEFAAKRPSVADYSEALAVSSADASDSSFRYQELYSALDNLSVKERGSILLYYMEGYSVKEIAQLTDANEDAVKQHLSRGRNHLRSLLRNQYL